MAEGQGDGLDLGQRLDNIGKTEISRRGFLKGLFKVGLAATVPEILAACAPKLPVEEGRQSFESLCASSYSIREYDSSGENGATRLSTALNEAMKERYDSKREWAFDNNIDTNYVDSTVKVMVMQLDEANGKVVGVYLVNDWRGFYNEVNDNDSSTGVNQEIDTHELFVGRGVVAVTNNNVMNFGKLLDIAEQSYESNPSLPVKFDFYSQKTQKRVELTGGDVFASLRDFNLLDQAVGFPQTNK